jgi:hypothetical protein
MSLIQLLELPDVAAEFSRSVRIPSPGPGKIKLLAPPVGHRSYSLIGTAFDYCFRFCVAAYNPGLVVDQAWVAEIALQSIEKEERWLPKGLTFELAVNGVFRARQLYTEFLESRIFTRRLARAALFLAAIDPAYRTGPETVETRYLRGPLKAETDDCLRLVHLIDPEMISAKKRAALNPSFGEASRLVGGADADLVIDDMLVEIKTSRYFEITPIMIYQLIGYRLLLAACEPEGSTAQGMPLVNHGAIYFSRYARLERFRYLDLIARDDFVRLAEWLINYLCDNRAVVTSLVNRVRNAEL